VGVGSSSKSSAGSSVTSGGIGLPQAISSALNPFSAPQAKQRAIKLASLFRAAHVKVGAAGGKAPQRVKG
jgi:hypothetical protein